MAELPAPPAPVGSVEIAEEPAAGAVPVGAETEPPPVVEDEVFRFASEEKPICGEEFILLFSYLWKVFRLASQEIPLCSEEFILHIQALVRLARTQADHKAEEYAAGLDEVRARWDSLNSSELQRLMLGLLGDPVRAKIAKEAASILKSATKISGLTQARPIRSRPWCAQGRGSCYRCGRWGYNARTCRSSQALFPYGRARGAPSGGWCGNSR
ncbi:uncharacterized protein LOC122963122 [Acropora millepora]|uniref:uncharacterized protein LOC122963122 n=1 Tax=Acropora millepora TaxID=45264 RepID=UPI001CF17612|nr:uncharacterized protein LOC122963122 [Acropora millepora]